jgi:hypothetical protein
MQLQMRQGQAVQPSTSEDRKEQIGKEFRTYCALATEVMIRIGEVFSGRKELVE